VAEKVEEKAAEALDGSFEEKAKPVEIKEMPTEEEVKDIVV
jgi:hypothetical protein